MSNRITVIGPQAPVREVRHRIVKALHRNADVDCRHIDVAVAGNTATLSGAVSTWVQREAAERGAAGAPGIAHVENRITVEPRAELNTDGEIC